VSEKKPACRQVGKNKNKNCMQIYCHETTRARNGRFQRELPGSVHRAMLGVLLVVFVIGGGYLYSVNQSAVQGYHMRTLEKEIGKLKQDNANLKIAEADLRSLYRIESVEGDLQMEKADTAVYFEERGSVALK